MRGDLASGAGMCLWLDKNKKIFFENLSKTLDRFFVLWYNNNLPFVQYFVFVVGRMVMLIAWTRCV